MNDLLKDITIYHKTANGWSRTNTKASVRNTEYLNRNTTGLSNADTALIRIFDTTISISKGDVIVNKSVSDSITSAPLTELRTLYGKENVYEVSSINDYVFDNNDLKQINHIKIGAR